MAKAYTEAQRAMAIEILNRHGGELNKRAIAEIRKILGQPDLPKVTIWRWLQRDVTAQKNATPEAKAAAAKALDVIFEETARKYLEHANKPEVVADASASQAMTAAAIAVDKMRLLRNLPTAIVHILPALLDEIDRHGMKASEVFGAMLEQFRQVPIEEEGAPADD